MDFNKDMKAFVLALSKLNNNEFCGVADLLNVSVWTDPLPVRASISDIADGNNPTEMRASNSEDAGAINTFRQEVGDLTTLTLESDVATVSNDIISFADRHPGITTAEQSPTNPFITANRSQPRDASDIIADMCEAFDQLPRSNKRYLLKLVKRAGGH